MASVPGKQIVLAQEQLQPTTNYSISCEFFFRLHHQISDISVTGTMKHIKYVVKQRKNISFEKLLKVHLSHL